MRLAALLCLLPLPAAAQQPPALSLDDAFRRALAQHPSLTRLERQSDAASARVRQAEAGLMPTIELQGAATNGPTGAPAFPGLRGLTGDPLKKHYGSGLNLLQTIYDFGRTQHQAAARRMQAGAAGEDVQTQRALVLLSVQTAYLGVLRAQQLAAVRRDDLKQREETARQAQILAEHGLKADVDAQLARANAADARVAVIAADNEVRAAFAALNNAMGATGLTEYTLQAPQPPQPPNTGGQAGQSPDGLGSAGGMGSAELDRLNAAALANRPELLAAELQIRAADQSIRAARSELMPHIDGIASAGALTPSPLISNNQNYALGVAATIPLYTGGLVEGRVAEERQKRAAAAAGLKELQEAVKLQVARAWLAVNTRAEQLKATREQQAAAEASLSQAAQRYSLQLSDFVELTTAEAIATRARAAAVDATYDLAQAHAELDWATGATLKRVAPRKAGP